MTELSVEIPTYNEAENLPLVIERIETLNLDAEIIVIDDNSPDGTGRVALALAEKYGNIKVISRKSKQGITSAVRDGLRAASGEYVAVIDCDMQHPPEMLITLLERADNGADVVIASRYVPGGSSSFSFPRKVVSVIATGMAHILLGKTRKIADPLSGFFIFRRSVIAPEEIKSNGYKVLLEILMRGRAKQITEVPFSFARRSNGRSKFGPREILRYLMLLLDLSDYRVARFAAVAILGVAINEGLLFVLEPHTPLIVASAMSVEASIVGNFVIGNFWTFRGGRGTGILHRLAKYNTVTIVGAFTNIAVLGALVFIHFEYLAANFVGIMLSFVANYAGGDGAILP